MELVLCLDVEEMRILKPINMKTVDQLIRPDFPFIFGTISSLDCYYHFLDFTHELRALGLN